MVCVASCDVVLGGGVGSSPSRHRIWLWPIDHFSLSSVATSFWLGFDKLPMMDMRGTKQTEDVPGNPLFSVSFPYLSLIMIANEHT